MHMLIRHSDGRREEAMLLSATPGTLRIALSGCEDATELQLDRGQWFSEEGLPVEIEFIGVCQRSGTEMHLSALPAPTVRAVPRYVA